MPPSFVTIDRAIGTVVASAVGDALGAGYEFGPPVRADEVVMRPGRLTGDVAGHWTDDTAMALAILDAIADHGTLASDESRDAVAAGFWRWWRDGPSDVGHQTASVLSAARGPRDLARAAYAVHVSDPERAGNGSLMRTGPVALAHLGDPDRLATAARRVSALTHPHPLAQDASVLWTLAIDRAITTGRIEGPAVGLPFIDPARRERWRTWIEDAERRDPGSFNPNGYVVSALQAAWSAIVATRDAADHLVAGLRTAVAIGDDTDTVAAIAGALLGAAYGVSAVPFAWRHGLGGWPGYHSFDLVTRAARAARGGVDAAGWPDVASLDDHYRATAAPRGWSSATRVDDGVIFGDVGALAHADADAVVSLCRVGREDRRSPDHELVWLLDGPGNQDAAGVLADTADAIARLRASGRRVFVHCVRAETRTPAVAATWLARHHGFSLDEAWAEVHRTLPDALAHSILESAVSAAIGRASRP